MDETGEIVLLGTGTSVGVPIVGCHCDVCESDNPRNQRTRTGVLVRSRNGNLLIDTPPELRLQLLREKVDVIHAAMFTHSHADHIFGLDDLRIFGFRLERPIPLLCEESVEAQIRQSFNYAFEDQPADAHHFAVPKLMFERIGLSQFETLGLRIVPVRLHHGRFRVLGFRIGNVAFCTDVSHIPDESWPLLEGVEVLIVDALRETPHPTHFSIGQALEAIERLKPRQAYLTHISHSLDYDETNAKLPPGVELAYDGLSIPFRIPTIGSQEMST